MRQETYFNIQKHERPLTFFFRGGKYICRVVFQNMFQENVKNSDVV
jgi:hypothetical protein